MLCLAECSPAKAADGRTHLIDAATSAEHRTFKHGFVPGGIEPSSSNDNSSQQQQQQQPNNCTTTFIPTGTGTVFISHDQALIHCCSLAQGHPVSRCATPEKITCTCVSPCGRFIALGGGTGAVYFLSTLTGEMLWLRKGHVRGVTCLSFNFDGTLLCSGSLDTTCRTTRVGMSTDEPSAVTVMTGHTLAVTACCFFKFINRVVSVSRDRTCRISDPLSGAVLRVFTAAHPLSSVCVGPRDSCIACGAGNGSLVFFRVPTTTVAAATTNSATTHSNNDHQQQQLFTDSAQSDMRVVGPFTGGPQSSFFFIDNIVGKFQGTGSTTTTTTAAAATTSSDATAATSNVAADAVLVAVSRDGFCQLFSWQTGAFIRDVVTYKRGCAAACVVPGVFSRSPSFTFYATTTINDKQLIQRSAIAIKKAPIASAGARVFVLRACPSGLTESGAFAEGCSSSRRRDRLSANSGDENTETLLDDIELEALKAKEQQLLLKANALYAAAKAAVGNNVE